MHRGFLASVPFMHRWVSFENKVISAGTRPPGNSSVSLSGMETRKKAQQAPHDSQGLFFIGFAGIYGFPE